VEIRAETPSDHAAVDAVHRAAFAGDGRIVPLVHVLRDAPACLPPLG
jgi:predicted N-acetyltransferase YhbS